MFTEEPFYDHRCSIYTLSLRQRYYFRDRFEDEHYFGLLKDEWHESV